MGKSNKYTVSQVEEAIRGTEGFLSQAALRLGCTYRTVYNYVQRFESLQQLMKELKEKQIDFAESKLLAAIRKGNLGAIIFFLKCQAKHRGYVERTESMQYHSGTVGVGALVVPADMTPEEWEKQFNDKNDAASDKKPME